MFYPTVRLPPDSFGTPENPFSDMLHDEKSSKKGKATIVLAYFTRVGDSDELQYADGDANTITLQSKYSPFD
jgi:hypothetical protein